MAVNFSPRKRRNKNVLPPQQRIISNYFVPRSGITKEEVNYAVKPEKEPNFIKRPAPPGIAECDATYRVAQITLPTSTGFTTAAKIHEQSAKLCGNRYRQSFLSGQPISRSRGWDVSQTCTSEKSLSGDSAYCLSSEEKQTHLDVQTRGLVLIGSSSSSSSARSTSAVNSSVTVSAMSSTRRAKRSHGSQKRQNRKSVKTLKSSKPTGLLSLIVIDSDNGESTSDSDCCIVNVVRSNKKASSDSEVEDISSSSQTSRSSQSSRSSRKLGGTSSTSDSSETPSAGLRASAKSSKQAKRHPSQNLSMYGPVGDDVSDSDDDSCEFSQLPVEIMENIFCQLPITDLMLNCVLVCRQWNSIISRDSFIPWKKKYSHLKNKDPKCEDEMTELLDQKGLLELEVFPVNLASFMKEFKRKGHPSLLENLKMHSKFPLIKTFLKTHTESSKVDPSPWSVVALLTLVCQTVYEVQEIVHCMTRSTSCLVQDILECFYCVASIYYCLDSQNRIGSGLHYRVFYTLYLYENAFEATCASINSVFDQTFSGQQSIVRYRSLTDKLRLTHEQVRIVKHDVRNGEIIKIIAFAGTGKTTTLVEYTKMRPMEKFLNVAYNKSIQENAVKTFPLNVESRTIHSLAFRGVGHRYKHKLASGLRKSAIMNALPGKGGYLHARRVEDTLKNFIASADTAVQAKHVPPVQRAVVDVSSSEGSEIFGDHGADLTYLNSEKYVKKVVSQAEMLWERMQDRGDKDFPMTHDGYLKLYQLSRPVLSGFDCLLIDEAQDCTPAASDILLRQSCAKILVGDPHQQIYAFRGARNALQEVQSTHTFYLTQSFRFGPEIAYVASCFLDVLKGIRNKTLVGGVKEGSVLGDLRGQLCVITRCNYTLFNEAVNVCCAKNDTKVGFVGGIQSLALARVMDIHKLFVSGSNKSALGIRDPLIKKFGSFSELKKYAKVAPDPVLLGKIKIVETHHVMLQQRIEKIQSKAVANLQQADIVFSTAHKAKGLEFDTVRVTDDFLPGADLGIPLHDLAEDEKNLIYVAVTRAKKCLQLNRTILGILGCKMEYFTKVVSLKKLPQPVICVDCKEEIRFSRSRHVTIQKETITLGGNTTLASGVLCSDCAVSKVPHLGGLVC